jgi:anti-anti-sigma regulatory factor
MASLLSSRKQDNEGIVHIGGELTGDASTANLEDWLEEHFVDDGVRTIRIDLSGVTHIDLEGAAALGLLAARALGERKWLIAEGVTGQGRSKLQETGLFRYLHAEADPREH